MKATYTGLFLLAVVGGCQQETPPMATAYPGMQVGPGGVVMPGMSVGPGGVVMPGMSVGPGGVMMPGVSVGPGVPGVPPGFPMTAAPLAGAPTSFGVPECDAYAQRACACPNEALRATMCQAAGTQFQAWGAAVLATPAARDGIVAGCNQAAATLAATCGG